MESIMTIRTLHDEDGPSWPEVLTSAPLLVLYKHSPVCMTSSLARPAVHAFHKAMPQVPVYQVDVITERGLAHRIAGDLQVHHESPQVIVVRDGRPIWHTSHFAIKAAALLTQVDLARRAQHADVGHPQPA
jgi:bacillithiol system protein YtxJ